jgi:hypothetical protein
METDLNKLTDVYLRHHARRSDEDFWAWQQVDSIVRADLSKGWKVTLLLLKKADTESALGYVAAGPLEDLIDGYGHEALDLVEKECDSDSRLQLALSGVWLESGSPVYERWLTLMRRYGFTGGRPRL